MQSIKNPRAGVLKPRAKGDLNQSKQAREAALQRNNEEIAKLRIDKKRKSIGKKSPPAVDLSTVENAEEQTDSAEDTKADSNNGSEKKKDKSPKKLKSFEIESEDKSDDDIDEANTGEGGDFNNTTFLTQQHFQQLARNSTQPIVVESTFTRISVLDAKTVQSVVEYVTQKQLQHQIVDVKQLFDTKTRNQIATYVACSTMGLPSGDWWQWRAEDFLSFLQHEFPMDKAQERLDLDVQRCYFRWVDFFQNNLNLVI